MFGACTDLVALSDGLFDHSHTVHSEARKFLKAARVRCVASVGSGFLPHQTILTIPQSRQVPQQSAELQQLATTAVPLAGTESEPLLGEIVSQGTRPVRHRHCYEDLTVCILWLCVVVCGWGAVRSICAEVRSEFMVGSAIQVCAVPCCAVLCCAVAAVWWLRALTSWYGAQKEHRQKMKASSEEVWTATGNALRPRMHVTLSCVVRWRAAVLIFWTRQTRNLSLRTMPTRSGWQKSKNKSDRCATSAQLLPL